MALLNYKARNVGNIYPLAYSCLPNIRQHISTIVHILAELPATYFNHCAYTCRTSGNSYQYAYLYLPNHRQYIFTEVFILAEHSAAMLNA